MRPSMPLTCSAAPHRREVRRRRRWRVVLVAAAIVTLVGLVGSCSAGRGSSSSANSQPNAGAQADVNKGQAGAGAAAGSSGAGSSGAGGSTSADRQVVQTGELHLTVTDPIASVSRVLTLVDQAGGRVDAHEETGGSGGVPGSATLTLRLPAAQVESTVTALRGLGDVTSFTLSKTDVTGAVQDLDARIGAARLSVARMQDLMSRATTTADLISTEQALSERQTTLEQLQAQRAALAEQVALSTLRVVLTAPGEAPAPRVRLHSFADGWTAGLNALGAVARGALIALGVLAPWLVLAALVLVGVVAGSRAVRRRRAARAVPTGPSGPPSPQAAPPPAPSRR